MFGKLILLGLSSFSLGGEPGVFENYFDDSIKEVDISQDSAIKACLTNGDTLADKVKAAYGNCFGKDYDFDELAGNDADQDSDNDGLPDSFEENEACFYKEMGWLDASGAAAAADVIKADLTGLEAELKTEFDGHIDACAAWSGSFGSRRKREAVPAVMESGSAALTWLRSTVRKTRSAESGDGKGAKKSKDGKGRKKGKKVDKRSGKDGKAKGGKGKGARKSSKKGDKGKKKGKKGDKRSGKDGKAKGRKGKGARKSSRKGEKGKKKGKKGNKRLGKDGKAKGGKGKGARKSSKKGENGKKKGKKGDKRSGKDGKAKGGKGKGARKSSKKGGKGKKENKRSGKSGQAKGGKVKGRSSNKAGKGDKATKKSEEKDGKASEGESKKKSGKEGKETKAKLDESTYNKLWCFDLSMEQVLEKCVEQKIKN